MIKKLFRLAPAALLFAPAATFAAAATNTQANAACLGVALASGSCDGGALGGVFAKVSSTLIFLVGAISVIMVIIGALRYVLSNGDSAGLKSAKDTILYALIGVAISIFAYALVAFVVGRFS